MRQWMCDPRFLCQKHICGEHFEMHLFLGSIKLRVSMSGYLYKNLFEPLSLKSRHDELVIEMKNRNMNHKTELNYDNDIFSYLGIEKNITIDKRKSLFDLLTRCKKCRERFLSVVHLHQLSGRTGYEDIIHVIESLNEGTSQS